MKVSLSSAAIASALLFAGSAVGSPNNIRMRQKNDSVKENSESVNTAAVVGNQRKPHRKASTLIEIKDDPMRSIKLEEELEQIFGEDFDHFDRMLQVYSFVPETDSPTKAPVAGSPTGPPAPPSSAAPIDNPTSPLPQPTAAPVEGSVAPVPAPSAAPVEDSAAPVPAPSATPVEDPTQAPVQQTEAPITVAPTAEEPTEDADEPSEAPTFFPTFFPTDAPTSVPSSGDNPVETDPTPEPSLNNVTGAPSPGDGPELPATTWDIIMARPTEFSVLIAVSEAVGFDEVLQTPEDRTIFAPNDSAFENIIPADLIDKYADFDLWTDEYISTLLFCHDVSGSIIFSFQFQNGTKVLPCVDFVDPAFLVTTPPLQISKELTMPVPANVVEGDLLAQNGVVHIIDQVLTNSFLRLTIPALLGAFGGFGILIDLVVAADLVDTLSEEGPFTIFAPTDEVFERYGDDFVESLKEDPESLRAILLNHVVTDLVIPCCLFDGAEYESAAGNSIILSPADNVEPRNFTVNGVETVPFLSGRLASNGKINVISDILLLPDMTVAPIAPATQPSDAPVDTPMDPSDAPVLEPSGAPAVAPVAPSNTPAGVPTTEGPVDVDTESTWDIIKSRPEEFATFILASEAIGFDTILQMEMDRTVFVPNEDGFASVMPMDLLTKYFEFEIWTKEYLEVLLFCHELTDAVILSSDLTNGTEISPCLDLIDPAAIITLPPPVLSKETMPVPANIVEVDLIAENGVVHVIDQVITNSFLRYNFIEAADFVGGYSILIELAELTGLLDVLSGPGPITIFAPSDEVFESKGQAFIDGLKSDIDGTREILLNHVISDVIIPCCLGEAVTYTNAAGQDLVLDNYNQDNLSDFTVNGISTVPSSTDLLTANAKVNTISDILLLSEDTENPTPSPISGTLAPSSLDSPVPPDSEAPVEAGPTQNPVPVGNVWDLLTEASDEFSTFISAAEAVGYDEILRSSSDITVFAPNEMAFANLLPPNLIEKYFSTEEWTEEYILELLSCHDIDGAAILSTELTNGAEFATCIDLLDPEFVFTSPPPQIAKSTMPVPAAIVGADQESLNGVVHVVDQVLTTSFLRFNMPEAAEALGTFTILLELVVLTDLLQVVESEGPFTIFAPSDAVFESYGTEFINGLKMDVPGTRELLLNHVVPDRIVPCCLSETTEFKSAAANPLVLDGFVDGSPNIFTVNGVEAVPEFANFLTSNAKINVISDFILPPNLS